MQAETDYILHFIYERLQRLRLFCGKQRSENQSSQFYDHKFSFSVCLVMPRHQFEFVCQSSTNSFFEQCRITAF